MLDLQRATPCSSQSSSVPIVNDFNLRLWDEKIAWFGNAQLAGACADHDPFGVLDAAAEFAGSSLEQITVRHLLRRISTKTHD